MTARAECPNLTELEVRDALCELDPVWEELFPAEQARVIRLLVERVEIGPGGAGIRLRVEPEREASVAKTPQTDA